jgi:hypothetical protein
LSRPSITFEGGEKKEGDAKPPLLGAPAGRTSEGERGQTDGDKSEHCRELVVTVSRMDVFLLIYLLSCCFLGTRLVRKAETVKGG